MNRNRFWTAMRKVLAVVTVTLIVVLVLVPGAGAASKYKVLHRFYENDQHHDGTSPYGGLIFDAAGNLYGTTAFGWNDACFYQGCGTAFKLTPNSDGHWTETFLAVYPDFAVPDWPMAGLVFDAAGNLYGTASNTGLYPPPYGGVFMLAPNLDGSWKWTTAHAFEGPEGANPYAGLILDASGNLYGTTVGGGVYGYGVVFELTPNPDRSWTESVLYSFKGGKDGANPYAGLVFDSAGNLYGTTAGGGFAGCGSGCGTVYKLTPSGGHWKETVLHRFAGGKDGANPYAGLIFDATGSLYGTTVNGGDYGYGFAYKLTPNADGSWTKKALHKFTGGKDGANPYAALVFDTAENLYGTTWAGGAYGVGTVFKLTLGSDGKWREHVLHAFRGQPARNPYAGLILDAADNLYGTTAGGNADCFNWANDCGAVFEITP